MTGLDPKITLIYSGPYTQDKTGEKKIADKLELEFIEEQREDLEAGLRGNYVLALPPGTDATDEAETYWEEFTVVIDLYDWLEAACEQSGGHNYIDHQWSEEPESACQICTRCGSEIDPA